MEYMTVIVSKKVRAMTCRNSTTTLPFDLRAVANLHPFKSLGKKIKLLFTLY
jgi:hypothetical protein